MPVQTHIELNIKKIWGDWGQAAAAVNPAVAPKFAILAPPTSSGAYPKEALRLSPVPWSMVTSCLEPALLFSLN